MHCKDSLQFAHLDVKRNFFTVSKKGSSWFNMVNLVHSIYLTIYIIYNV